ncbi:hypothetical protein REPUB_Repub08aG0149000 [Reevesia pubescens]
MVVENLQLKLVKSEFGRELKTRVGGHAVAPHSTVDPILAASFAILALQQLTSERLILSIVKGGSAFNLIPPYVEFGASLRSLTTEGLHDLQQRLKEVKKGQAAVHRCNASIDMTEEDYPSYPAVVYDESLHQHVLKVGSLLLGPQSVKRATRLWQGRTSPSINKKFLDSC